MQIFIGADNPLFANTGCSMVVAPFRDSQERILGAIGVIGPTRLNYARIIPLVDYTARTIGRMVGLTDWSASDQSFSSKSSNSFMSSVFGSAGGGVCFRGG